MVTRRLFWAALAAAALVRPARPEKKPHRKPDIEFSKVASSRQGGSFSCEGDLRVAGEKPVAGLVLLLQFFETGGALLTIQKIQVEEGTLQPGDQKHFSVQGNDVPRAVSFRLAATDRSGRDLSTAGVGPYQLD
jgi:hypothetical protein